MKTKQPAFTFLQIIAGLLYSMALFIGIGFASFNITEEFSLAGKGQFNLLIWFIAIFGSLIWGQYMGYKRWHEERKALNRK